MEFKVSHNPVPYEQALRFMEERVEAIRAGNAEECLWFLEHPPLYTAGTSANPDDLLASDALPVFQTGRGGEYTYHGPGQRVVYVMLDLKKRYDAPDIKDFVKRLEEWIIRSLKTCGIKGERRDGRIGIWVDRGQNLGRPREDKIAALGIRIRRWVSFHGISINVSPDLSHFKGIVPCGIKGHGVTSFKDLNSDKTMADLDEALRRNIKDIFQD